MKPQEREKWKRYIWDRVAVNPETVCWEWRKAHTGSGYGAVWYRGKMLLAHRIAFEAFSGRFTNIKRFACHKCDNPGCVNPGHLYAGSPKQNMQDCSDRGRRNSSIGEDAHAAILTEKDVRAILELLTTSTLTQVAIAARFGVTNWQISKISRNRTWRHLKREALPIAWGRNVG